ncbi:hypothetical protein E3N88_34823 [Mikania micrantha]|uniref:Uncharacterized protein n=1 Tax=Mikania micrantha TaxID=192012 RepID=A0A5N6M1W7_9ASTR|nr:hypothetical protein E3N88_34823 [Mikania micrantha]
MLRCVVSALERVRNTHDGSVWISRFGYGSHHQEVRLSPPGFGGRWCTTRFDHIETRFIHALYVEVRLMGAGSWLGSHVRLEHQGFGHHSQGSAGVEWVRLAPWFGQRIEVHRGWMTIQMACKDVGFEQLGREPVLDRCGEPRTRNPNLLDILLIIPRKWLDKTLDPLYFCVEEIESYAWTPRTRDFIKK